MIAALLLAAAPVLTLTDAEKNTHDHLPAMRLAIAQTAAQKAVRDQVFSNYMPSVSGSATLTPILISNVGAAEVAGAKFPANTSPTGVVIGQTLNAGVKASQLIWDFNQTFDKIHAADANVVAQKDNENTIWNNALQATRNAYFICQQDLALVGVARKTLDDDQQHVDEMQAFVQAGTHAQVDLVQAQQVRAAAKLALVQAQGNYRQALANLQQAMGLDSPPGTDVNMDAFPGVEGEEKTTDDLIPEALAARPEIQNLKDQMEAQRLTISATRESWLPSISANASLGATLNEYLGNIPPPTPSGTLNVGLTWPFYQGGLTAAAVAQAEAIIEELQAQFEADKLQVRNDLEVAMVAIRSGKEQIASAHEAETYANEQLRLADGQYKAGVGIALAVFDAEVSVTTAGGQIAQSDAALAVARAQLVRALGREKY